MVDALRLLEAAVSSESNHRVLYQWKDLRRALYAATSAPLDWKAERILLTVMRFDGVLPLDESSELPHSMTPEDMLKSLAVQALARWTGLTHLLEMQRVEATAVSPALASVVRAVIRQKSKPKPAKSGVEAIAVTTDSGPLEVTTWRNRSEPFPNDSDTGQAATEREAGWPFKAPADLAIRALSWDQGRSFISGPRPRMRHIYEMPEEATYASV